MPPSFHAALVPQPQSKFLSIVKDVRLNIFESFFNRETISFGCFCKDDKSPLVSETNGILLVCRQIYEEARPIQAQVTTLSLVRADALTRLLHYPDDGFLSQIRYIHALTKVFNPDAADLSIDRLHNLKKMVIEGTAEMHSDWKIWNAFNTHETNNKIIEKVNEELGPKQFMSLDRFGRVDEIVTHATLPQLVKAIKQQPNLVVRFIQPFSWWPGENEDGKMIVKFVSVKT